MASIGFSPAVSVSLRPNVRARRQGDAASGEATLQQTIKNQLDSCTPLRFPCADQRIEDGSSKTSKEDLDKAKTDWIQVQLAKVKTMHALLFLCLNVGADPPDCLRVEPYAKLECWMDPVVAQAKLMLRGSEAVGEALEAQYKTLQPDALYKRCLEPSVDDVKNQLVSMRKKARDGRVLFHYNGHGVPKATHHGEIWFFDREHTHYYPINIGEIALHSESPTLYVFDCNSAGVILSYWKMMNLVGQHPKDMFICACKENEMLPMNPLLPADILTSCLTSPLRIAVEWYIHYSHRKTLLPQVSADMIQHIPGEPGNRKTPLGELNFIFSAITDTIAWCTVPRDKFFMIFRQDVMLKKHFPQLPFGRQTTARSWLHTRQLARLTGKCAPSPHVGRLGRGIGRSAEPASRHHGTGR